LTDDDNCINPKSVWDRPFARRSVFISGKKAEVNERWLRWQARLGASKLPVWFAAITAFLFLGMLAPDLTGALGHLTGPRRVTIHQLINQTQLNQYVRVAGTARYDLAVKQIENNRVVGVYYALVDQDTNEMVWVRSAEPTKEAMKSKPQHVTLEGITCPTMPNVRARLNAILFTSSAMHLNANQTPMNIGLAGLIVAGLGIVILVGVVAIFCPQTVFVPEPIPPAALFATGEPGMRVSGFFHRIRRLQPWIEFSDAVKHLREVTGELVFLKDRCLFVRIHHIAWHSPTSISAPREIEWGALIVPDHLLKIEPGKLYGWHDRWAVRLTYCDADNVPRALIVSFNHSGAQAEFINWLTHLGYSVSAPWPEMV